MINCYTDASYNPNQDIGVWASIIINNGNKYIIQGTEKNTNHNRLEIFAVIQSIQYIQNHYDNACEISIYTDSQYVVRLTERQTKLEIKKYKTNKGKPLRNLDLIKQFLELVRKKNVHLIKVKAHQKKTETINYNRKIDQLVRKELKKIIQIS